MSEHTPEKEKLLQFPCSFPIKVMGRDKSGFRDAVVGIVQQHAGDIGEHAVRVSASSKGNFVSVTITIQADSQEQLDNIYRDLTARDDVLFSL
jgi:uncharacterized protein